MYKNNKKTQINNMRNKKRAITRDKTEIKDNKNSGKLYAKILKIQTKQTNIRKYNKIYSRRNRKPE